MQAADLKFPGGFTSAQTIRRELAHAISQLEIAKGYGAPDKPELAAFLLDAAQKTPGYVAPTLTATQTILSHDESVTVQDPTSGNTMAAKAQVVGGKLTVILLNA